MFQWALIQIYWQTTYENFRYRYDKKENPYNRGIVKNLTEILLSKPPRSLVNFREWVIDDDESIMASISHKFRGDIMNPKAMLDIESGKLGKDGIFPLEILQKIDYSGINDSLKKEGGGNIVFDPFLYQTAEEVKEPEWRNTTDNDRSEDSSHRSSAEVHRR